MYGKDGFIRYTCYYVKEYLPAKESRNENYTTPIQEPLRSYGITERWHIDIRGPYSQGGKKFYFIGARNAFSNYMVAKMVTNKTARNCLEFFTNDICLRFRYLKHISRV